MQINYTRNLVGVFVSVLVFLASVCPAAGLPQDGLVAFLKAEGNALDSRGTNDGTLLGAATFTEGPQGKAFAFYQPGEVAIPASTSLDAPETFTIAFWMRAAEGNQLGTSYQGLVSSDFFGIETSMVPPWIENPRRGIHVFAVTEQGVAHSADANQTGAIFPSGEWHHVAGTYDGERLQLFVDGKPHGAPALLRGRVLPMLPGSRFSIGSEDGRTAYPEVFGVRYFQGNIDEVAIFSRALSTNEVELVYKEGIKREECSPLAATVANWWKAETDTRDSVGSSVGILRGATTITNGLVGNAFSFAGAGDEVAVTNVPALQGGNEFTIEFWMRAAPDNVIGDEYEGLVTTDFFGVGISTVAPRIGIQAFATTDGWNFVHTADVNGTGVVFPSGEWHHIAATYDSAELRLFVDGQQAGQGVPLQGVIPPAPTGGYLSIGSEDGRVSCGSSCVGSRYFRGQIDEVSIYTRALSQTDIHQIFAAGSAGKCAVPPPPCLSAISNTVSWWRFEADAQDEVGENDGLMVNGPTPMQGEVGRALSFVGNQYVELTNSPSLSPTGSFSIEGWIYPRSDQHQAILAKWGITEDQFNQRSYNFGLIPGRGLQFSVTDYDRQWDASFTVLNAPGAVTLGAWSHVAAVFDQPTGTRRLFVNGAQVAEVVQEPFFVFNSSATPSIGAERNSSKSVSSFFDGVIDELAFYSRALSGAEVQSIYAAGAAGKCVVSPVITQQPANASVPVGGQIRLSVAATPVPVGYQWRLDGGALEGQTNQFLSIPEAAKSHAGAYDAVLTFSSGTSLTSQVATVSVLLPVVIKTQPASVQVPVSTGFRLTVEAEGDGSLRYQWFKNGNPLPGAFDRTLTVNRAQPSSAGVYHVVVNNDVSSATSEPAVVSVVAPPLVHLSPSHRVIEEGGSAVFTAWVSGAGWWQWSKDGLALNVTNLTLRIENAKVSDSGTYTLTVTNLAGKAVASAVLVVNERVYVTVLANGSPIVGTNAYVSEHPVQISLASVYPDANTYYTLDGSDPSFLSTLYTGPFTITRSSILRVRTYDTLFTESGASRPVEFVIVPSYTLSVTNAGGGSVSFTPDATSYASNTLVRLWAQPAPGWRFLGWLGAASGTNWDTEVRMTSDKTVQPIFGRPIYSVLTGSGSLLIDPPGPFYPYGTVVRFTVVPEDGQYLAAWGGAAAGNANPAFVTVTNGPLQIGGITAELPEDVVALTVVPQGFGSVTWEPATNLFRAGSTVTLTAAPHPGQTFVGWRGDLVSTNGQISLELTNSTVLYAEFTAAPTLNTDQPLAGFSPEGFTLSVRGEYGSTYNIESTTSLLEWTTLGTVTNTFGVSQFTDPAAGTNAMRLYRAVKP